VGKKEDTGSAHDEEEGLAASAHAVVADGHDALAALRTPDPSASARSVGQAHEVVDSRTHSRSRTHTGPENGVDGHHAAVQCYSDGASPAWPDLDVVQAR
jgi:hypothetical protein